MEIQKQVQEMKREERMSFIEDSQVFNRKEVRISYPTLPRLSKFLLQFFH